ncbi:hypothetical protein [Helicobacter labetoulli]|uniref:hypothetical protein n=1 Tax=Helicobacter labetoulli TaxID=2315333 RepID=UPI0039E76B78
MQHNLIVFGLCLALVAVFSFTGLSANTPKLNVSIVLFSSLKIIFGFCLGIVFFIFCIAFQSSIFERYDFTGRNYGIPFHKRVLFQDLGF